MFLFLITFRLPVNWETGYADQSSVCGRARYWPFLINSLPTKDINRQDALCAGSVFHALADFSVAFCVFAGCRNLPFLCGLKLSSLWVNLSVVSNPTMSSLFRFEEHSVLCAPSGSGVCDLRCRGPMGAVRSVRRGLQALSCASLGSGPVQAPIRPGG